MNLEEFLKLNGVDYEGFIETYARKLMETYEAYDDGIARFAVYGDYNKTKVDIKDVLGVPRYLAPEAGFLDNFVMLFDPYGDNYHSRANGMLKYTSSEVLTKLDKTFKEEPIRLYDMGGKYYLSSNGNHRIHLFMMHYLMDEFKEINVEGKYQIPVETQKLDLIKTYANYIGSLLWDERFKIYSNFDNHMKKTGKSEVLYRDEQLILSDNELIAFVRDRLEALKKLDEYYYIDAIQSMWVKCKRENSGLFKQFVESYLPELVSVMETEDFGDLENEIKSSLIEGVAYGNN